MAQEKKTVNNNSNNNRVFFFFDKILSQRTKCHQNNQGQFSFISKNEILKGLLPENSILVANKRDNNLKDLLLRIDPYNLKRNVDNTKHGYKNCKKKCDSCNNFEDKITAIKCFATGRIFKIRRHSSCQTKNVIYVASGAQPRMGGGRGEWGRTTPLPGLNELNLP